MRIKEKIALIALLLASSTNPACADRNTVGDDQMQKALNQVVAKDASPDASSKATQPDGPDSGPLEAKPIPPIPGTVSLPAPGASGNGRR